MRVTWRFPISLVASLWRNIKWLLTKQTMLSPGYIVRTRLDECKGTGNTPACPHYDGEGQCRLCDCFVGIKAQLWSEKCPDDRWRV